VQVVGQLIPAGLLATTPLPVPAMVTVRDSLGTTVVVNDALTVSSAVNVKLQLPVPEQAPLQPLNT
jgi:hypothetical protein